MVADDDENEIDSIVKGWVNARISRSMQLYSSEASSEKNKMLRFVHKILVFYAGILQIVRCNKSPSQSLHVFAEKFKPFFHEMDNNRTYIGINYLLIQTIGEHLNMGVSFDLTSTAAHLENWKPSSRYAKMFWLYSRVQ